jgi:predicted nucleic acid-binding protein
MTNAGCVYLIDTNVLIYAYDERDPVRQRRAIAVLSALEGSQLGALTVQVLGEFFVNALRKPLNPLTLDEAQTSCRRLCRAWTVYGLTDLTHLTAIRGVKDHVLSYWDAVLWATALENDVPYILTEDQQHKRLVDNVRYLDPFSPDFDLAILS